MPRKGLEYIEPETSTGSLALPDSVASDLVLDLPGADLSAFTAVPVPAVTPLGEISLCRFPSPGSAVGTHAAASVGAGWRMRCTCQAVRAPPHG